ncbi:MAG: hypothetical protein KDA93_17360 [Planctomycetaceae bacterium]|nr:hypothetical protein [Planctomycetaceae bacterium]
MSIEAFLWNYAEGEPVDFEFDVVRDILSTDDTNWNPDYGILTIRFCDPESHVDVFVDKDGPVTNHIRGIMVDRPIVHPDYLSRVLKILQLGNVMLFYSDNTTPNFWKEADPKHYPPDLLDQLGTPRFVDSPEGLLHLHQ